MTGSLRTGSLRVRLLVSVMSVVLVLLVGIVVATTVLLQRQLEDSAADSLAGRAATAQQLLDNGAEPNEIVSATQGENVAAQIVTTDGRIVGDLTLRATTPPPALRPPPVEPGGGPPPGPAPADRAAATRVSTTTLSDGSVLTVAVDASSIDAVRSQLLTVLVPLVLVATAVAALLMAVVVQASLRPLRTMTALARSITRGHRGDRLNPTRSDTELGETATAFDEMLDELEGAEARERATADRTRQFVDDAAHDLRTPVAGISAAAETLLRRGVDTEGEVRERLLASMIRESRRAATLIDDLLVSARTDDDVELDRRDHDLLALARTDAERIRLLHPDVHITVAGSSVIASVDAARFARILANLTDNAVRHGPTNGTVTVTVCSSGDTGVVAVRDDGPGIAVGDRDRIFDRMVRLDDARSTEGSGLGLTIARTYARAHGGDVVYDGAAFVVTVPPGHGPVDAAASDARA